MDQLTIELLHAYEILDSRGTPTIAVEATLRGGAKGSASVPSGASTGSREAVELRDGERDRYRGRGVRRAIASVIEVIGPALRGLNAGDQPAVDARLIELDGTPGKSRLGANAILGVSVAVLKAASAARGLPLYRALVPGDHLSLPVPQFNVLNGGRHAARGLDFQELMIVPLGAPTFAEALRAAVETYWALAEILGEQRLPSGVGDEGGFAPPLPNVEAGLHLMLRAIERAGYRPGDDVALALDPAASEFYSEGRYVLRRGDGSQLSSDDMINWYRRLVDAYPIVSLEDGLAEWDWEGWKRLTDALGKRVILVGDDIFVTSPTLIREGAARGVGNAVLIKPNQIGTVTETLDAIRSAREGGRRIVVSHRSGETEDTTIADLAVAVGAEFIKTGAPCRGERIAKYNRLLRIEADLGARARYPGRAVLAVPGV